MQELTIKATSKHMNLAYGSEASRGIILRTHKDISSESREPIKLQQQKLDCSST